jgi:hypothetical protein
MIKIRDTITIGTTAGIIGTFFFLTVNYIFKLFGYQFTSTWEATAGIFMSNNLVHTPLGNIIGFLGEYAIGASVGISIAYILKFTGYDYYILKGLGIGAFYWIVSVGVIGNILNVTTQFANEPVTNFLIILDLFILSLISVLIIIKFSDIRHKS